MPRGRPKKRLTRMDAAVDAMLNFGFPEAIVKKNVRELLKEYGGDEGWHFIEDCAYKELIDSILREQEMDNSENKSGDGDVGRTKDKSDGEEEQPSPTPNTALDNPQDERSPSNVSADPEPPSSEPVQSIQDGKGCNGALPDQMLTHDEETAMLVSKSNEDSPGTQTRAPASPSSEITPTSAPNKRGRSMPSYGWIESDEEDEDDFITLQTSTMVLGPARLEGHES